MPLVIVVFVWFVPLLLLVLVGMRGMWARACDVVAVVVAVVVALKVGVLVGVVVDVVLLVLVVLVWFVPLLLLVLVGMRGMWARACDVVAVMVAVVVAIMVDVLVGVVVVA